MTEAKSERSVRRSGIYEWVRYVDAESRDDPRAAARKWIDDGAEPDEITASL